MDPLSANNTILEQSNSALAIEGSLPKYTQYLGSSLSLEDLITIKFADLNIGLEQQENIRAMLAPLKAKEISTYEHCLRVGILASDIGDYLGVDSKALFYAGLMHDVGKALTPIETLTRTDGWSSEDQAKIEEHVIHGVKMLGGLFEFSAAVILYHHRFQSNPYPKDLPEFTKPFSDDTRQEIVDLAKLLTIADTFDALHRVNSKHGQLNGAEIRERMLELHSEQRKLVHALFCDGVLTTYIKPEPITESNTANSNILNTTAGIKNFDLKYLVR
jgi:putative nucleotidyltransferase with HDIG domain